MRKLKNIEIIFILIAIAAIAVLIWWALQKDSKNQPLWVAGLEDSGNNIIFSRDGLNWSDVPNLNFSKAVEGIAYGKNLWVAVGDDGGGLGNIMYSDNGKNWTQTSSGDSFSNAGAGVAYGTSNSASPLWVAVGDDDGGLGSIMYSDSGKNWTQTSSGDSFGVQGWGVAYGTSDGTSPLWVAVGDDNKVGPGEIMYSENGKIWQNSSGISFEEVIASVVYSKTKNNTPLWLAIGKGVGISGNLKIYYSNNGKVWKTTNYVNNCLANKIAYEQELYGTNKSFYH